jgi:hypothetical protein
LRPPHEVVEVTSSVETPLQARGLTLEEGFQRSKYQKSRTWRIMNLAEPGEVHRFVGPDAGASPGSARELTGGFSPNKFAWHVSRSAAETHSSERQYGLAR